MKRKRRSKCVSYAKWGYIFLIPFFLVYFIFQLLPLISTFYNSFFENYRVGLMQIGPKFVGLQNYKEILFNSELPIYLKNTFIIWMMGFIPQMFFSLLLASWFTDLRLRLKCTGFFKTVIYMPNLIMASAFSMLFYTIFSDVGPINNLLNSMGLPTYRFLSEVAGARGLIALMNFLMWFGNTTLLLISGVLGIDPGLFEAADIDGATGWKKFRYITLPLLKPIMLYTLVTSAIGGLQMYDIPALFNVPETGLVGLPDDKTTTMAMYIMRLYNSDVGKAAAVSVVLFIITLVVSLILFATMSDSEDRRMKKEQKQRRKAGGRS